MTNRLDIKFSSGFPGGSEGTGSACNVGDPGSILGLGRSPGEGNAYPLQYSCLEDSMNRRAWWATVHGVTESDMTEQLTLGFSKLPLVSDWKPEGTVVYFL